MARLKSKYTSSLISCGYKPQLITNYELRIINYEVLVDKGIGEIPAHAQEDDVSFIRTTGHKLVSD